MKFDFVACMKICQEIPNLLKIGGGGGCNQALYIMTKVCFVVASNITCHRSAFF
jgi:hypothetical protein